MSDEREPMTAVAAALFSQRIEKAAADLSNAVEESKKLRASNRRGRLTVVVIWLLAVYVAITLHDEHIHRCMLVGVDKPPAACDVLFPFHDHDDIQDEGHDELMEVIRERAGT